MAVIVKADWGFEKTVRGKQVPCGPEYLYSKLPEGQIGKYWWGNDISQARTFDSLEAAQDFVTKAWAPEKIRLSFEFIDSITKEVIATDARDDPTLHATEKGEGRSSSSISTE